MQDGSQTISSDLVVLRAVSKNRASVLVGKTGVPGSRPDPTFPGNKDGRIAPTSQDCVSSEMLGYPWGFEHAWLSVSRSRHLNGVASAWVVLPHPGIGGINAK